MVIYSDATMTMTLGMADTVDTAGTGDKIKGIAKYTHLAKGQKTEIQRVFDVFVLLTY